MQVDLCNGHLTRHFQRVSLARAYSETKDKRYTTRFSQEVQDWVAREPFLHPNPSSFAAHDDGGAHTCVASLQTALMLPEFEESERWEEEAVRRWEEVLKIQFHADGSHVSLSTGYKWASIMAMENRISLYRCVGRMNMMPIRKFLSWRLRSILDSGDLPSLWFYIGSAHMAFNAESTGDGCLNPLNAVAYRLGVQRIER